MPNNKKLSPPAFAGESQSDRAASATLHLPPVKCDCLYVLGNQPLHDETCPRYIKPSDDLPF